MPCTWSRVCAFVVVVLWMWGGMEVGGSSVPGQAQQQQRQQQQQQQQDLELEVTPEAPEQVLQEREPTMVDAAFPDGGPGRLGWRYSGTWDHEHGRCEEMEVHVTVDAEEVRQQQLKVETLDRILSVFQRCGVVAVHNAIPLSVLGRVGRGLQPSLRAYVASRDRLRAALVDSVYKPLAEAVLASPDGGVYEVYAEKVAAMWDDVEAAGWHTTEPVFTSSTFRERNDGRIDVALPFSQPFNDTQLVFSPFVYPALAELLGLDVRLKGVHAVVALNTSQGIRDQHWHRDTGLLFEPDEVFHEPDVHHHHHGVHLPPFAINVFVPLVDFTAHNGATEFTLGSHMWGPNWHEEEAGAVDVQLRVPAGTVILADYRTVHRGTINRSYRPRPMAMLIYGRQWWFDTVNYGSTNKGGARVVPRTYGSLDALLSQLPERNQASHATDDDDDTAAAQAATDAARTHFQHLARIWHSSLFRVAADDVKRKHN